MIKFNDFTKTSNEIINEAIKCAESLGHIYVGSEHLLVGLLSVTNTRAYELLKNTGILRDDVVMKIESIVGRGIPTQLTGEDITPRSKRIFENALNVSLRLKQDLVRSTNILTGILIDREAYANLLLKQMGVDLDSLEKDCAIVQRGNCEMNIKLKFNFGDEVYVIRTKPIKLKCQACNGIGSTTHLDCGETKFNCHWCCGSGEFNSDKKMWYVLQKPLVVREIRVKASSSDNYTVRYNLRSSQREDNGANTDYKNLFATKQAAQKECDIRNQVKQVMKLEDIKISSWFSNTTPCSDKIKTCYENYKLNGKMKEIIVNKTGVLLDGYVGYLVCKMFGVDEIEVLVR
jgi:hypothetical protein